MEPGSGLEGERTGLADLIGLDAGVAMKWARDAGYETSEVTTRPPWPGEARGSLRVLRVRLVGRGVLEFTVAAEEYVREGRGRAGEC